MARSSLLRQGPCWVVPMVRLFKNYRRWIFFLLGILAIIAMTSLQSQPKKVIPRTNRKPNIIFILADDMGWNDIGYHGSDVRTPVLDSMAASGVKLENYYVQPICSPTRGQLMLGRYQIHTGLQSNNLNSLCPCGLPLEFPTLADKLRQNGYATDMVGKWHLGFYKDDYLPTRRGFDSFYGFLMAQQGYFTHLSNKRCHKRRGLTTCFLDFYDNDDLVYDKYGEYSTHLFRDRAVELIEKHARDKAEKPLFMYLSFQAVHLPREAPREDIDKLTHIVNENRRVFAAMALSMDEAVGRVVDSLKRANMWGDTLVIFSSDNGGISYKSGNNWPLRGVKGSLWEGGIHVPAFVSGPFLSREGATSQDLMHVTDWFPTLVGLAGGDTSGMGLDGHDMWATISREAASPRTELLHNINHLYELTGKRLEGSPFDNRQRAAIRVDNWKLITGSPGSAGHWIPPPHMQHLNSSHDLDEDVHYKNLRLFDVVSDPSERVDLADRHPDIVDRLLARLAEYDSTAVTPIPQSIDMAADPAARGVNYWGPWVNSSIKITQKLKRQSFKWY